MALVFAFEDLHALVLLPQRSIVPSFIIAHGCPAACFPASQRRPEKRVHTIAVKGANGRRRCAFVSSYVRCARKQAQGLKGFSIIALSAINTVESKVILQELRIELKRFLILLHGFGILPRSSQYLPGLMMNHGRLRIQLHSAGHVGNRIIMPALEREQLGVPLVGGSIVGIESQGFQEFFLSAFEIPIAIDPDISFRIVGFGEPGIERERFFGGIMRLVIKSQRRTWEKKGRTT
jgi:hypothetical protein